ncbi:MAG: stage II sporulation protein E [Thermoanaerobacteraceae bacterium]|nr:stage II sporulation protein E [Thermoanaerobacteraceae bacterium]
MYAGNVERQTTGPVKSAFKLKDFFDGFVLFVVMGFFVGRAGVFYGSFPFGLAYIGSVAGKNRRNVILSLFCILGLLSAGSYPNTMRYLVTYAMLSGAFYSLKSMTKTSGRAFLTAGVILIVGMAFYLLTGRILYDLILVVLESVIVFSMVFVFDYTLDVMKGSTSRRYLGKEEIISIGITYGLVIASLKDIEIYGLSLWMIAAISGLIIAAYAGGLGAGAAMGVLLAVVTQFTGSVTSSTGLMFSLTGLLAGAFSSLGMIGSVSGSFISYFVLDRLAGYTMSAYIKELLLSSLICFLIPSSIIKALSFYISRNLERFKSSRKFMYNTKEIIFTRLKDMSGVMSELATVFDGAKNSIMVRHDVSKVIERTAEEVCSNCIKRDQCWGKDFYYTYQFIFDMITLLELKGEVTQDNVPRNRCINLNTMIKEINNLYDFYMLNSMWQKRLDESQRIVSDQLKGLSRIVSDLAETIKSKDHFCEDIEEQIFVELDKNSITPDEVIVLETEEGKHEIFIKREACFGKAECSKKIEPIVSKVMEKEYRRKEDVCRLDGRENSCMITLVEKEIYNVTTGVSHIAMEHSGSGDNFIFSELSGGRYLVAISDGMGTGKEAGIISSTAVGLLEKFMNSGFTEDITIRSINSILNLKLQDDMFTTMDISIIDRYTGTIEAFKMVAPSSYIKRKNSVDIVKKENLPAGALEDISVLSVRKSAGDGDMLIMITDGVVDSIESENRDTVIQDIIRSIDTNNPQEMAEKMMKEVLKKGRQKDDMTIVVSKIWD